MMEFTVARLSSLLGSVLPEPHSGLMTGLLFGTKSTLSYDFTQALITTGTLHIVALSGMNIAILTNLASRMLQPVVGRRVSGLLILLLIMWFVLFVGPSPTIVRAAMMGSMGIVAYLFGRSYISLLSWIITVLVMGLLHAEWIFDISFQLSVCATLGIILFGQSKRTNPILNDLHLTMSAQVFTIPLILFYFHRISLISPLSNIAIAWVIAPLTALGWLTVLLGYIWLPLGQVVAWVDWIFLEYIIRVVGILSKFPGASIEL